MNAGATPSEGAAHAPVPPAGLGPGDLVAVALEPGPSWPGLVADCWRRGIALLPIDHRLPKVGVEGLIGRARPAAVLERGGWTMRGDAIRVDGDVALVVATSGTSGDARLVQLDRAAVEAAVAASTAALDASAGDGWLCALPLGHIGGLNVLLRAVVGGARVEVLPGFDVAAVRDAIGRVRFTSLVPTTLARCLDAGVPLHDLDAVLVGGAELPDGLSARARDAGARIVTTYGLTESCGGVVYDGVALPGTEVRVVDDGRVHLRGPTLMRGYLRDDDASADALRAGWLVTGDVGSIGGDGRLAILGRADDAIVTGGEVVMPLPVERALAAHPDVLEVAVVGRPDPEWGRRVVAVVVPRDPSSPPDLQALRDLVAERLPRHAAPRQLVLVDSLPRSPGGKVLRRALRAAHDGSDDASDAGVDGNNHV